jgi:hypothetical protein
MNVTAGGASALPRRGFCENLKRLFISLTTSTVQMAASCLLSDEPDPRDLLRPFPAEPMRMWPISTRVNKPENDDPSIVEPIRLTASLT